MALLFVFAAALQYNDEGALPWIAMYLAAAAPCVFAVFGRPRWRLASGVAILAFLWACVYLFQGAWRVPPSAMFSEWTMSNDQVREARELYGLALIAGFMAFSATVSFKRSKPR
jgi:hypothetical protein